MIAWALSLFAGFSLRLKLALFAIGSALIAAGYFWMRWKISSRKAQTAQEKAAKLEATRALEKRIASGQASLKARQAKLRAEILSRKGERDYFSR